MKKNFSFLFILTLVMCFVTNVYSQKYASQAITAGDRTSIKVVSFEAANSSTEAKTIAENLEIIWHKPESGAIGDQAYYSKQTDKSFVNWSLNDQRVAQYENTTAAIWEHPTHSFFPKAYSNKSGSLYLVIDETELAVLDTDGTQVWYQDFPQNVSYAAAYPDGTGFYCSIGEYPDEYTVYSFLLNSNTPVWSLTVENTVVGIALPEDHSELMVCLSQPAQKAVIVNPLDGEVRQELYYYNNSPSQSPAFSSNGDYMVLADFSGKGTLYKRIDGIYEKQWQASLQSPGTTSVWGCGQSISADGSTIAFGTLDFLPSGFGGSVYVYNNYSNEPLWSFHNCGDEVAYISMTDDGSLIACAGWGPINHSTPDLYIFRKQSAEPVCTLNTPGSLNHVDIAPDGSKGITSGKGVHAREMGSGGNAYLFRPVPSTYGNISGKVQLIDVTDHSLVLLSLESINDYHTYSNEAGDFDIKYIPEGTYTLKASKQGYYSKTVENIVVTGNETTVVNIELEPAGGAVTNLFASQGAYPTVNLLWNEYTESHTGYNIYRKRNEVAPFTEIFATVGAGVTEFIDDTALPTYDYYYGVTAQISDDLESLFSNVALGYVSTSFITREIDIYNAIVIPTIDGVISDGEWDDAFVFDASDFLGSDGRFEPVGSVIIYIKADENNLYVAVENKNDTQLSSGDRTAFYIDDNFDGSYGEPGDESEGNYWINYGPAGVYSIQYRPIFNTGGVGNVYDLAANVAASDATGYVVAEFVLPIGDGDYDITPGPGNKSKAYIYVRDGAVGGQDGQWPYDNPEVFVPIGYGTMNFFIEDEVPPPPTNLRYTPFFENTPEFVAIAWDFPNINDLGYFKVAIKNLNTEVIEDFETTGNQLIYEVEDHTIYHVTVITVDKAGHESAPSEVLEIIVEISVSIVFDKINFKLYPNPTNSTLIIDAEITEPAVIEIYNISGMKIYHQLISDKISVVNVSNFAQGIYFIKVKNSVRKFVKY